MSIYMQELGQNSLGKITLFMKRYFLINLEGRCEKSWKMIFPHDTEFKYVLKKNNLSFLAVQAYNISREKSKLSLIMKAINVLQKDILS